MSPPQVLALIPARGGSKGIPDKNVRELAGMTLIERTARVAAASGVVTRAVLSTDSERIADVGRRAGVDVPFMRPPDLARDDTPMLPVIMHAVEALERGGWRPDIIALLQPTSPLRRAAHIRDSVERLRETRADSVVTVLEVPKHLSPDYVMRIEDGHLVPFLPEGARMTRRQDVRPAYVRDGTAYVFWRRTLAETHSLYGRRCVPLVIPPHESLTLDTADDWTEAERRLATAGDPQSGG